MVVPLSSVFPSETAACLTTFHTGEPPVRHGLIGWGVYVEALETVVEPLPFRTVTGDPLGDRTAEIPRGELLFDAEPIYHDLQAAGVSAAAVQPAETVGSPYSERALEGAAVVGYESPAEMAGALRDQLEGGDPPQYLHGYYPEPDEAAHREGTGSAAYRAACSDLGDALAAELASSLDPAVADETLLLVTADHGAVNTDPTTNVDLFAIDGVREQLQRTASGTVIPPAGGPRNVHLRARPGQAGELRALLDPQLDALVLDWNEAIDSRLFGDAEPSALFEQRAGDLLVVPETRSVWYGADSTGLEYVGMHGGLHPDEFLVPLASAPLADLAA